MASAPVPRRAAPRTTAIGALAIFLPLFVLLLWWAFTHRVAPIPAGQSHPRAGTLTPGIAIVGATFAAAGPAVFLALLVANHSRVPGIFRPRRARVIAAVALFLLVPAGVPLYVPFIIPGFALTGWGGGDSNVAARAVVLAASWAAGCLAASGARAKLMRVALLALAWWGFWGALVLRNGFQGWL